MRAGTCSLKFSVFELHLSTMLETISQLRLYLCTPRALSTATRGLGIKKCRLYLSAKAPSCVPHGFTSCSMGIKDLKVMISTLHGSTKSQQLISLCTAPKSSNEMKILVPTRPRARTSPCLYRRTSRLASIGSLKFPLGIYNTEMTLPRLCFSARAQLG